MWRIVHTKTFDRQYNKLDSSLKQRVNNAIKELETSDDQTKLGKIKKGQLKNLFAYYLGKYRIIYDVYRGEITILLMYVGKHKEVYGSD